MIVCKDDYNGDQSHNIVRNMLENMGLERQIDYYVHVEKVENSFKDWYMEGRISFYEYLMHKFTNFSCMRNS